MYIYSRDRSSTKTSNRNIILGYTLSLESNPPSGTRFGSWSSSFARSIPRVHAEPFKPQTETHFGSWSFSLSPAPFLGATSSDS